MKARKKPTPPATLLLELLREEVESRRQNRVERLLKRSGLPLEKSRETYDLRRLGPVLSAKVKVPMEGGFVRRKEDVLCFGTPGNGKSHLLCAVAQELVRQGMSVYFAPLTLRIWVQNTTMNFS